MMEKCILSVEEIEARNKWLEEAIRAEKLKYADKVCSALNDELRYEQYLIERDLRIAGALLRDKSKGVG